MTLLHLDVGAAPSAGRSSAGAGRWPRWRCCTSARPRPARFARSRLPVALVTSVVGGLGAVATARCAAVGVSPLSGAVGETRSEGPFAAGLRAAGVTGVSLTGRAPRPSYVVIEHGRASVHDAGDLWGWTP